MRKLLSSTLGFILIASVLASSVTINGITLSPVINGSNLELTVTGNNSGYIGLGLGSGMAGVDMLLLHVQNNVVHVVDAYCVSNSPAADSTQSGTDDATVSGTYSSGAWNVVIVRPLAATNPTLDKAITPNGSQTLSVALGSSFDLTSKHANVKVGTINFPDASQTQVTVNSTSQLVVYIASIISLFALVL